MKSPIERLMQNVRVETIGGGIYDKRGKCVSWNERWIRFDELERVANAVQACEENRPKTKTVYQWRYKNAEQEHWKVAKTLLTPTEAAGYYLGCDIQKHAGPFEVPE